MMAGYKEILVATDFTGHSEAAARRALELAEVCDARIQLLYVVEHFPEDVPSVSFRNGALSTLSL